MTTPIVFENDANMTELAEIYFSRSAETVIFMSHYDLANATGVPAERWKQFLTHPKVSAWISQELYLFKDYQFKQMLRDATDASRSVGAAQMMNALSKVLNDSAGKEGATIIYTYVPPLPSQEEGSDTRTVRLDTHTQFGIVL